MGVLGLFVILTAICATYVDAQTCAYTSFPNHTMCIYSASSTVCPTGNAIKKRLLTSAQQTEIVNIHNTLRAKLVAGTVTGQPKAKSMAAMSWDAELATIAQRAADQCLFAHDKMRNVVRFKVGQNIYRSGASPIQTNLNPNMTAAAMAWWNEVITPGFNPANINPFVFSSGAGHYTQMAWATTTKIGCGYVMYTGLGTTANWSYKLIFCNYGTAGNVIGQAMYIKV